MNEILREKECYAKEMFLRLRQRRLFKAIFEADQNDFPDPTVRSFVFAGSKDFHKSLEYMIAKQFGFDENYVIAYMITFAGPFVFSEQLLQSEHGDRAPHISISTLRRVSHFLTA